MALHYKECNIIQYASDQGRYRTWNLLFQINLIFTDHNHEIKCNKNQKGLHHFGGIFYSSCLKQDVELSLEVKIPRIVCLTSHCS